MPSHFPDGLPAVLPATVAQIQRRLPAPGDITVRVGSRIEPDDPIGQAIVPQSAVFVDIASALGIEAQAVPRAMRRKVGERVAPQQVLAKRRRRKCMAPQAGTLSAVDAETGYAIITPDPVPVTLTASVRGYVADVMPGRSALIETPAAMIQGVFGIGGEQFGVLRLLVTDRHDIITPDMIDARSAYALIIGGAGITAEALRKAQQEQVRGVIVGSIEQSEVRAFLGGALPDDWYAYGQQRGGTPSTPTVLVTEGFGAHPMAEPLFDLLTRYDRQEAFLDGCTTLLPPLQRPRLVIPLPRLQGGQDPTQPQALRVGSIVRLVDERHMGMIGRVQALSAQGQLPSGLRTPIATVQVSEAERIVVPQTAIEVIG
ncbi:MAG TPA: hypothetical protein VFZ66_21680 [Herpetosiphonaceae bacterium]